VEGKIIEEMVEGGGKRGYWAAGGSGRREVGI